MKRIAIFLLLCALLAIQAALPQPALADVAPPINPPGAALEPGAEATAVEMRAERVLIDVKEGAANSLGVARVTADFSMHNPSSQAEQLAVRFPISANDGRFEYPEIANIQIRVNGRTVRYARVDYPSLRWGDEELPWAEFNVEFPAGVDTQIQVSYDLQGSGYFPYTAFYYVLHTGAGWAGNIGRAEITLRLPFPANSQNVVLDTQIGWAETTPSGEFDGNEVRWVFEDFEPGEEGQVRDMEFALVAPAAWKAVLSAQAEVQTRPRDGEAWGRLGKRYKDLFLMSKGYRADPGGLELYDLSVEAYEECLRLKPDDAQWHAGFAELLAQRAFWDSWGREPIPESYRALEEMHTALQLAPDDMVVKNLLAFNAWMFPEGLIRGENGYIFLWLTQTPTPIPPTPTLSPSFDPKSLPGTYISEQHMLSTGELAQLTLHLNTDQTAILEIQPVSAPTEIARGNWAYGENGIFQVIVDTPNDERLSFFYRAEGQNLTVLQYPALIKEGLPHLHRVTSPTPTATPQASATPSPTWTPQSPQQTVVVEDAKVATAELATPESGGAAAIPLTPAPESTPATRTGPCGSLVLVLLPLAVWLLRRRS